MRRRHSVYMRVWTKISVRVRAGWVSRKSVGESSRGLTAEVPPGLRTGMPTPRPEFAPQRLTNFNGEREDGSSNKTPHIGVPILPPPLVALTLQQSRKNRV